MAPLELLIDEFAVAVIPPPMVIDEVAVRVRVAKEMLPPTVKPPPLDWLIVALPVPPEIFPPTLSVAVLLMTKLPPPVITILPLISKVAPLLTLSVKVLPVGMLIIKSPQMVAELVISSCPPLLKVRLALFPEDPTVRLLPLPLLSVIAAELLVVILPIVTLLPVMLAFAFSVTPVVAPDGTEAGLQLLAVPQSEFVVPLNV